jgi:hypothetical protein
MWDYLLQNKVRLLANMNNKEAAYALQKILIDKASNDPVLLKKKVFRPFIITMVI